MKTILYRSFALIISLGIFFFNFNQSVGQVLTIKSGSFNEKGILRGQSQEVKVIDPRGNLQWQQSDDGINWLIWSGKTEISVVVVVNESLFLRCAIQEANCDRVFSDVLKLIPFEMATVTTNALSEIQKSSAVGGGNIVNDGGDPIQQRGVCWSLNQYPTLTDNKTIDGEGIGSYSSMLTGLTTGTLYYVRAYAVNSAGTAYGNQVSFTTYGITLPSVIISTIHSITSTTAAGGGHVIHGGNTTVTARGLCWSTSQNPTTVDSKTTDGIGTGVFTSSLTDLTGNTTYYVRAYATNSAGTSYENGISFKTSPVLPTVTTTAVSDITQTTASSGGYITSDEGADITARGVCWAPETDMPTTDHPHTTDGTGNGLFTSHLTGLTGNTRYFIRAYATSSAGTSYGNAVSFTTKITDSEITKNVLVTDGDSRTLGPDGIDFHPYGPLLKLDKPFNIYCTAVGGATTAYLVSRAADNVDSYLSSSINIVVIWAGINDIAASRYYLPASVPYNNLVSYCKERKAKGWKVIICTEISVGGTGPNGVCDVVRTELNDSIKAHWREFADGLADLGADKSIGHLGAYKDNAYFVNELHLTEAGTNCVAEVISKAVNAL